MYQHDCHGWSVLVQKWSISRPSHALSSLRTGNEATGCIQAFPLSSLRPGNEATGCSNSRYLVSGRPTSCQNTFNNLIDLQDTELQLGDVHK